MVMSGQDLLVGVALIGAAAYLFLENRRAHQRAKVQSGVCARCKATRTDGRAEAPEVRVRGTINPL
jgi:hypothetical protein